MKQVTFLQALTYQPTPSSCTSYTRHQICSFLLRCRILPLFFFLIHPSFCSAETLSVRKHSFQGWFSSSHDFFFFLFSLCLLGSIVLLAFFYTRDWRRWKQTEQALRLENSRLQKVEEHVNLLMGAQRQIIISWIGRNSTPQIEGDIALLGEGFSKDNVLDFPLWVCHSDCEPLSKAIELLIQKGESFLLMLKTKHNSFVSAEGRAPFGKALIRFCELDTIQGEILKMSEELEQAKTDLASITELLNSISHPVWLQNERDGFIWSNKAYLKAVGAHSIEDVRQRSLDLLGGAYQEIALEARKEGKIYAKRISTSIGETIRVLDVIEEPTLSGRTGLAIDISDLEQSRKLLQQEAETHLRTLDQLSTAVAIFDKDQRLVFHNAAYQQFWRLEPQFLETRPSDSEILERLRAYGRLPEQANFRQWINEFLSSYEKAESRENWWYLPDRRTVRVFSSPNPQGGLTYFYDDLTDRVRLESQMNSFRRVQNETLDALKEGVAVFGSDGRLNYYNRAFAEIWEFMPETLQDQPHIDEIIRQGSLLVPDEEKWVDIRGAVAGLHDMRLGLSLRLERTDKRTIDCSGQPLPDGATLLTFSDVTASVNIAKALTERNEALEEASRMRDNFVHHFSYQVRSPLTNVIGFTQLLDEGTAGILNSRQKEYIAHIMRSSSALLAILNDILDLASIDTGSMQLQVEEVDLRSAVLEAARGLEDRMTEAHMNLNLDIPASIPHLYADRKRIRQILFNLLSNAVSFSDIGQTICVVVRSQDQNIAIDVIDQGKGIPDELQETIFRRFETIPTGSRHRGLGLGLSIVWSLVELHGGFIELHSEPGHGTRVTCIFPNKDYPQFLAA